MSSSRRSITLLLLLLLFITLVCATPNQPSDGTIMTSQQHKSIRTYATNTTSSPTTSTPTSTTTKPAPGSILSVSVKPSMEVGNGVSIPVVYVTNVTCYVALDLYNPQNELIATSVNLVSPGGANGAARYTSLALRWVSLSQSGPNFHLDSHIFPKSDYEINPDQVYSIYPVLTSTVVTLTFPTMITFNVIPGGAGPQISITWNTPFQIPVLCSASVDSVILILLQHATTQTIVARGTLSVLAGGQTTVNIDMTWNNPAPLTVNIMNTYVLKGYVIAANTYATDPTTADQKATSQYITTSFAISNVPYNEGMYISISWIIVTCGTLLTWGLLR